jgi:hypothetical protein
LIMLASQNQVIGIILRHDAKVTSYKIALLRAINDVVLSFPDLGRHKQDIAVPLQLLAQFWIAYYWPFVDPSHPMMQGPRAMKGQSLSNDMAFRAELTAVRQLWEAHIKDSRPSDGFFLINELRIPRKRQSYPAVLIQAYDKAIKRIANTIEMPIRYAGPGEWSVFARPKPYSTLANVVPTPGTQAKDVCLVITAELWQAVAELSLWIEALCIHEWCLFTERVKQGTISADRGDVYRLLTDRPDNRRPLTWERNNIDLLIMEGKQFTCPWTERRISTSTPYDLDHLVPLAIYPINELWNLVPTDPRFNSHVKRDRLPSAGRLVIAMPHLVRAYSNYDTSTLLSHAMREDAAVRFAALQTAPADLPVQLAQSAVDFLKHIAASRNWHRF